MHGEWLMKSVVSYLAGIPSKNKSPEKPAILTNFIQGVNKLGDRGIVTPGVDLLKCDLAVLQGFVHVNSKNTPHLQLRQNVIDFQKKNGNKTLIADSNLFLFATSNNKPGNYLRYSLDGVFRKTGFYFDEVIDPQRWQSIKTTLGIDVKPYRKNGNHILICLQRNGGWSMKNIDVMQWCHVTISEIRKYSDRHIVVRGHPGDGKTGQYLKLRYPNVTISNDKSRTIIQDLQNAWATITYNSSPGVASLINGVPVFQLDSDKECSMYSECANFQLHNIENPKLIDRQKWLERISMCHWSFDELQNGQAWSFIRNYV